MHFVISLCLPISPFCKGIIFFLCKNLTLNLPLPCSHPYLASFNYSIHSRLLCLTYKTFCRLSRTYISSFISSYFLPTPNTHIHTEFHPQHIPLSGLYVATPHSSQICGGPCSYFHDVVRAVNFEHSPISFPPIQLKHRFEPLLQYR